MSVVLKFVLIAFSLGYVLSSLAQENDLKAFQFPDKIPADYVIDPHALYEKAMLEDMGDCPERDKEIYCEMVSFGEFHHLTSGTIYLGWRELELYLNTIKDKLLPDSIAKDRVRVYLTTSSDLNAYTTPLGNIYFNIGLLASLKNEAQIALIMGHELSHYLFKDSKANFLKEIQIEYKGSRKDKKNISIISSSYSRFLETQADSIGFELAINAGYNLENAMYGFEVMLFDEELRQKSRSQFKRIVNLDSKGNSIKRPMSMLLSSHPELRGRIEKFNERLITIEPNANLEFNPQGNEAFENFNRKVRTELLFQTNRRNLNYSCLFQALEYHLFEPDNHVYIYFALESLRRILYLDPDVGNNALLTETFGDLFEKGRGILSNINFIVLDTNNIKDIKAQELIENNGKLANTYDDALNYFKKKAVENSVVESYLSLTLLYLEDEEKRDFFLKKYLTAPSVMHKKYAEHIYNNKLIKTIVENTREVVLMEEIALLEERTYGYHFRYKKAYEEEIEYYNELEDFFEDSIPNVEFIPMGEFRSNSYAEYNKLVDALYAARKFVFYAEELEMQEIRNADIVEGVNVDGSETFVFDDDDEEPLVLTAKDKREYRKKLRSQEYSKEKSKPQELGNKLILESGLTEHNLFVYAPYAWEYFEEHDIVKVEYFTLFAYRNVTFSNIANSLFFREKFDHSSFKIEVYRADARLKKADFRYEIFDKEASPKTVRNEINDYYTPDKK